MPGGLAAADAAFPDLGAKGSTEDRLRAVQDYLYMLLETLRWTLRHLSGDNFDDAGLASLAAETVARHPEAFGTIVSDTVITNELYAAYGAVADLAVDELRTDWQKAVRCLAGNTGALDWLHIADERIDFLTGTVRFVSGVPQTEQLHRGDRKFWWTDGSKTQMTSLEETDWPVIVYQYNELLKGTFRFEDYTPPGGTLTKVPTLILGAGTGDQQDPDLGKGFIRKGTTSLDIWLHGAGADNGLFIGEYTDLVGLRKTTALDFSGWDNGSFSETVDGNLTNSYAVAFDNDGLPVKITDAAGHETAITW